METKILILGLICLFGLISGCEKLPTSPDLPDFQPVSINYFTANPEQVSVGEYSMLSWKTTNASRVRLFCDDGLDPFHPGISAVWKTGTMVVQPKRTIIYTLFAYPMNGSEALSEMVCVIVDPSQ